MNVKQAFTQVILGDVCLLYLAVTGLLSLLPLRDWKLVFVRTALELDSDSYK